MIFEMRCYVLKTGTSEAFMQAQHDRGFELVRPALERLVGFFQGMTGEAEEVVHLYRYDDLNDWMARLQSTYGIAALEPYFRTVRAIAQSQESSFLLAAPDAVLSPHWNASSDWLPAQGALPGPLHDAWPLGGDLLIEFTRYQLAPGHLAHFWPLLHDLEQSVDASARGVLIGHFSSWIGPLHNVYCLRMFRSAAQQQASRAAFRRSAAWEAFTRQAAPMLQRQHSRWMRPFPIPQLSPWLAGPG